MVTRIVGSPPARTARPGRLHGARPGPTRRRRPDRARAPRAERGQRPAAARVVPHARRDHPAGPGHPAHLPQPPHRIGHEMNDQLRQRGIEGAVGERQPLGRGKPDIYPGQPLPHRGGERRGRFHRADRARAARLTSTAVSAPGPQPTSSSRCPRRPRPDQRTPRERLGVLPHESQIGARADIETHPGNLLRCRRRAGPGRRPPTATAAFAVCPDLGPGSAALHRAP